jgi:hypothetical protein
MGEEIQPNQSTRNYLDFVRKTAYFTGTMGKTALRPLVWGLEFPSRLQPHIAQRLEAERPRSEAKIALDAIMRGRAHHDQQLVGSGEAMLTRAVQRATTSRVVPEEVTDEVVQIARGVHLDPTTTGVDPFVARHVEEVLKETNDPATPNP